MEIKITEFFVFADPAEYSASRMELGDDAGRITWQAAKDADFQLLTNDAEREAFRNHIKDFGAWDAAEIAAMSDSDLNALFIQLIAGDIRESGMTENSADEFAAWETRSDGGGRMFRGDDGEVYYLLGS
jgi:hypothetical protein